MEIKSTEKQDANSNIFFERDKQINTLLYEFQRTINKISDFEFRSYANDSGAPDASIQIKLEIDESNSFLEGTNYYYKPNKFYHFTNLPVLYSILNEKAVRMYNLNKSNDQEESQYAAQILNTINNPTMVDISYDSRIKTLKEFSFIFSSTITEDIFSSSFWQSSYVNPQTGIALEFEIINDPYKWKHFYSSKIKYGNLEIFKNISYEVKKIQEKYKNHLFEIDISPILGFHKSYENWNKENEFRIITIFPHRYKKQIYHDYFVDSTAKSRVTKYIKLPLYIENNKNFDDSIPLLKLKNIFFSKAFNSENHDFRSLVNNLNSYINERLGYSFNYSEMLNNRIR